MDNNYKIIIAACEEDIKGLIYKYGDMTIYKLDPIYNKYGVDVVNYVRHQLRGLIIGL